MADTALEIKVAAALAGMPKLGEKLATTCRSLHEARQKMVDAIDLHGSAARAESYAERSQPGGDLDPDTVYARRKKARATMPIGE